MLLTARKRAGELPASFLQPRSTWPDGEAYDRQAAALARMFVANFAAYADGVPADVRATVAAAVGVAGTATSCAAIAQELDPYDPNRVEGYVLELGDLELLLARLASMPLAERRKVIGLHPDRAPTIVAGVAILLEALRTFDLDRVEVSERDILWGAAIERANRSSSDRSSSR